MDSTEKALRGLNICAPVSAEDDERGCAGCPYDPEVCTHRRAVSLPDMMIEDIRAALGEALRRRTTSQKKAYHLAEKSVLPRRVRLPAGDRLRGRGGDEPRPPARAVGEVFERFVNLIHHRLRRTSSGLFEATFP